MQLVPLSQQSDHITHFTLLEKLTGYYISNLGSSYFGVGVHITPRDILNDPVFGRNLIEVQDRKYPFGILARNPELRILPGLP